MNGLDNIETNAPHYDHEDERVVVPRIALAREVVVDVAADGDQFTADPDDFGDSTDDARFEQITDETLVEVASRDELAYFDDRDGVDVDVDEDSEREKYEAIADDLDRFDRVSAKVETDKTYSPNVHVRARRGYGAPGEVFQKLLAEFDADDVLAVEPTETRDGDLAIMYRARFGGYDGPGGR